MKSTSTGTTPPTGLGRLLRPRAIAIVGASSREGALSRRFAAGLQRHGFAGRVVPVNPSRDEIDGLPCAPSIAAAASDDPVDLAVISLPRAKVRDAVTECARAGVAGAIVFTSGYGEVDDAGRLEQERLAGIAHASGMRLLGPNSPGFVNVTDAVCVIASGVSFRERFVPGGIAVLSQSGGAAGLLIERAQDAGAGISVAVCTGNEADVTVGELLTWLAEDPATRVAAVFLEGVRAPDRLLQGFGAMRAAGKSVVVLKAGATESAARATTAHTGALATADEVVDAVFRRHGVARVFGFDDLVDATVALDRLGPSRGRRVGIVTTSGGAGVVATEAAERAGLELPQPSAATRARLAAAMPAFGSARNPADMSGMFSEDQEIFRASLAAVADAEEFDATVLVLTVHPPAASDALADRVLDVAQAVERPPAVLWMAGAMSAPARERLRAAGLAVFEDAGRAMRALAARAAVAEVTEAPELGPAALPALPPDRALLESEVLAGLASVGVPSIATVLCPAAADAAAAAASMGAHVAVKAAARGLAHKSEAGAVLVGVPATEVADAHERVVAAASAAGVVPEGSIVQATAKQGIELIVGVRRDELFGPVLVVGRGGVTAELDADVSRRPLPLRVGEAETMLRELRCFPILDGYRGAPRADLGAAAGAIEAVAAFALALGDRLEAVEVNPLLVHAAGEGATAVDALLLRRPAGAGRDER